MLSVFQLDFLVILTVRISMTRTSSRNFGKIRSYDYQFEQENSTYLIFQVINCMVHILSLQN